MRFGWLTLSLSPSPEEDAARIDQQIEQVDRDLFTELSTGLPPQKKAQLALVMARLPMQLREMARGKGRQ